MAKVIILRKGETIGQLHRKLQRSQKSMKGINTEIFAGTVALTEDPLMFQKRMRNEWS